MVMNTCHSLKRECHIDEIFIAGCNESYHLDRTGDIPFYIHNVYIHNGNAS